MNACENPEILRVFFFFNLILNIVKIVVPIGLIVMGLIDFSRALTSNDESTQKKSTKLFIKRVIMAVLVFFVPWIVETLIIGLGNLADGVNFTDCLENATKEKIESLENSEKIREDVEKKQSINITVIYHANGGSMSVNGEGKNDGYQLKYKNYTPIELIKLDDYFGGTSDSSISPPNKKYIFIGWYDKDGKIVSTKENLTIRFDYEKDETIDLYAKWHTFTLDSNFKNSNCSVAIIANTNGGKLEDSNMNNFYYNTYCSYTDLNIVVSSKNYCVLTAEREISLESKLPNLIRENFDFQGWNLDPSTFIKLYPNPSITKYVIPEEKCNEGYIFTSASFKEKEICIGNNCLY